MVSTKPRERDEKRGLRKVVALFLADKGLMWNKPAGPNTPELGEDAGRCCGGFQIGFGACLKSATTTNADGSAERSWANVEGNLRNLDLQVGPSVLNEGNLETHLATVL